MILSIIEEIQREPSSNGKLAILEKHKNNEVLKLILQYTYSPLYNYYTKHQVNIIDDAELDPIYMDFGFAVFPILDKLIARQVTGHAAIDMITEIGRQLEKRDRVVLNKIIARDLDMGLAIKSINKVFPNLIPTVPYMRCSLADKIDRITYPAIVQQKCDGMFVNVVVKNMDVKFYTRNGTEFDLICIKEELKHAHNLLSDSKDIVYHGELLVTKTDGDVEDRKIGNGLINSLIKKEQTLQHCSNPIVVQNCHCIKDKESKCNREHIWTYERKEQITYSTHCLNVSTNVQ